MSVLTRHIGNGEPINIDGDEIMLKPLSVEDLPDFFKAMKSFSGAKEGATTEELLRNVTDEGLGAIQRLIEKTLEKSLPEVPIEERKVFGLKYMMVLFPKIMEINMSTGSHEEVKKKALLDAIKK